MNPAEPALDELAAAIVAESARFASFGWMRGTSGNLSAVVSRAPFCLAVTASGKDKGSLTPGDIVLVDANGQAVAGFDQSLVRPSAEAALHARVALVAGAGAVVHVHTVASVVASRRWPTGITLADLEMLKGIGLPAAGEPVTLPVLANSQDMGELSAWFEGGRDPRLPAVVVANHGLYAWGADLLQARHHTEIVQWLLELAIALP